LLVAEDLKKTTPYKSPLLRKKRPVLLLRGIEFRQSGRERVKIKQQILNIESINPLPGLDSPGLDSGAV
jgi:hypothetical protein